MTAPKVAQVRRRSARRWCWAGAAALVIYMPLQLVSFPLAGLVGGVALLAFLEARSCFGWADGYEACAIDRESDEWERLKERGSE